MVATAIDEKNNQKLWKIHAARGEETGQKLSTMIQKLFL